VAGIGGCDETGANSLWQPPVMVFGKALLAVCAVVRAVAVAVLLGR
jgi:hypothetical protein